ncbi:MAG TPA: glycosyl hydrolase family 65 protein [Actinomycetes bacterium]|nr:glycosyl hydrolase family 65 protein [Actinomycetes bacterium]
MLERTFEAVVFDWDGTAVPDRRASARAVRRRVEALCARGVDVAVVSGTHVGTVDGQLGARPPGPGRLFLALNRGSELYVVDRDRPRLLARRRAGREENAALDLAAAATIRRLTERGLAADLVASRLNRRKIDLIPVPAWADPPKARIHDLLAAVTGRLEPAGFAGLADVVAVARRASEEAGLTDPRITSDAKHVEIGLTDKSDSMRALLDAFAERGVGPGITLVLGDEFGRLGGVPGSDSLLLVPQAARATVVSVGVEPTGVPAGVRYVGGGPPAFLALLDEQLARRRHRRVPAVDEDPAWVLVFDGDPLRARVDESLLSLGDGFVGVRGSHDHPDRRESPMVLVSGAYTGSGAEQRLLHGPWPLALASEAPPTRPRRVLDLRTGVLVQDAPGTRSIRFVALPGDGVVAARTETAGTGASGPLLLAAGDPVTVTRIGPGEAHARASRPALSAAVRQVRGRDASVRTHERLAGFARSAGRAASRAARASEAGFERLLHDHRRAWAGRWADVDVSVPDEPGTQLAVRFALFHLWNVASHRAEAGVGARGLSGTGYSGHVFWDADVFVLPALATMDARAARAMLGYRLARLPQARENARRRGLEGARFPWESAATGEDVTPTSGRLGEEWVPILTGELEEHVVSDVAWAACFYADWTGDAAFLDGPGRDLVVDGARYLASRAVEGPDGRAHIRHVIGPDEYHEDVDDNAYTNLMARWHLRAAADLVPASTQTRRWRRLAAALVDGYDPTSGRHEQFTGYDRLRPLLVAQIGEPPIAADVVLGPSGVAATQVVKQPDVLMAHHLLGPALPAGSLRADLDHYLPRTAHGSSLSPPVVAALLARAGRPDEAMQWLDLALRMDLDDLTRMTASGVHLATVAGVWQALVFGFAGARVEGDALRLDPVLPSRWGGLGLRFRCRGRRVGLEIGPGTLVARADGPLRLRVGGYTGVLGREPLVAARDDDGWRVRR